MNRSCHLHHFHLAAAAAITTVNVQHQKAVARASSFKQTLLCQEAEAVLSSLTSHSVSKRSPPSLMLEQQAGRSNYPPAALRSSANYLK